MIKSSNALVTVMAMPDSERLINFTNSTIPLDL